MAYDTIKLKSPQFSSEAIEAFLRATGVRSHQLNEKAAGGGVRIEVELPAKVLPILTD